MIRFIEWNYVTNEAIEYERLGECNSCGQCCLAEISMVIAYDEKVDGKRYGRDGGTGTDEEGIWLEIEIEDASRFYKITDIDTNDKNHRCPQLSKNSKCLEHCKKANICKDWPMSPQQVIPFPDCSYSFKEINRWQFGIDRIERDRIQ